MQKSLEILVRSALLADMPIGHALRAGIADIFITRAGIVDADLVTRPPAQHIANRLAMGFAEKIPQRNIHCRIAACLGACRTPAEIEARQIGIDRLDLQRVAAQHFRSNGFMQIGLDRLGAHKGLAQPDHTFVGMQPHKDDIAEFLEPQGFQCRDFHERRPCDH